MRLFTGVDLAVEMQGNLSRLVERLRPSAPLKWSSPGSLHITTKFIGEWPEARLEELTAVLGGLPLPPPLRITVQGLGWFPNPREPRVFWAGVKADTALAELARDTDRSLARIGVARESRPFSPHLTLARIKAPAPLDRLREAIAGLDSEDFGSFVADRHHLYRSELTGSGSVYTKLASFSLAGS